MTAQQQRPKPPPYLCFTVPKCVKCEETVSSFVGSLDRCARRWARGPAALIARYVQRSLTAEISVAAACRFQLVPFLESLTGLLFANFFWVGLWDLLDNTIFPNDYAWQMYLLVRGRAGTPRGWRWGMRHSQHLRFDGGKRHDAFRPRRMQIVLGVLGLYFTNSCVPGDPCLLQRSGKCLAQLCSQTGLHTASLKPSARTRPRPIPPRKGCTSLRRGDSRSRRARRLGS